MTSNSFFPAPPSLGAALVFAAALAGCSTVADISPFTSDVPYAQNIKPNLPQPAVTEIPAFKPAPKPAPRPKPPEPPASETAPPPAPASATPPAAEPPASPAAAAAPPAPAAQPLPPPPPPSQPAPAPSPPPQGNQSSAAPAGPKVAASAPPKSADSDQAPGSDQAADADLPTIPAERRAFNDDGVYPNLARVPSRPVNMPTFAEAAAIEKSLQADQAVARDAAPASPAAPSPDSKPVIVAQSTAATAAAKPEAPVAPRLEDRSPCLGQGPEAGDPLLTVRFKPGSAVLTADDMMALVDALPSVRSASGTIRIFGHGDTETGSPVGAARFDLAAARAGAVAQALSGYGIAVSRVAVGVACADAAVAGASVQLYAES